LNLLKLRMTPHSTELNGNYTEKSFVREQIPTEELP